MATYAVGDLQGCYEEFRALLDSVAFEPSRDRLWLVGDLVNRGPRSLDTLRFVRSLGERAVCVLGNHDLHLLAAAQGLRPRREGDTFDEILEAPDRDELLAWVRHWPLLHADRGLGYLMVHAGVPPGWTCEYALEQAAALEAVLRGDDYDAFLREMYGNEPDTWHDSLRGSERLRYVTNAFTRMRLVDAEGRLLLGARAESTPGAVPWFAHPRCRSRELRIVFGHWSTLQLSGPVHPVYNVRHLDMGCVWGNRLCALRLEDDRRFEQPCHGYRAAG